MAGTDLTVEILKDIRSDVRDVRREVRELREETHSGFETVNQRLDVTVQRLDVTVQRMDVTNQRLDVVESTMLNMSREQRRLVQYTKAIVAGCRDEIEPRVIDLERRVGKLEGG